MFITRNRYGWWESCTSAGVYEAVIAYLLGPGWDEMEGWLGHGSSRRHAWVICIPLAKV